MKVAATTTRRVSQILHGHRAYSSRSNVIHDTLLFLIFFCSVRCLGVRKENVLHRDGSLSRLRCLQCTKILSCVTNLFSTGKCLHICYVASTVILSIARPMIGAAFLSPDKPGIFSPPLLWRIPRRLGTLIADSHTYISNYIYVR